MGGFLKGIEDVVAHNSQNEVKKTVHITYKKLNGRTVKRKIDPGSIKNGLIIAYDHKRKATRSFKIDRVKDMKKIAESFCSGFIKEAYNYAQEVSELKDYHKHNTRYDELMGVMKKHANTKTQAVVDHVKNHYGKYLAGAGGLYAGGKLGYGVGRKKGQEEGVGAGYNMAMQQIQQPEQEKQAEALTHAAELAGLSILAAPSVAHMAGKKVNDKTQHKAELVGLGVLAAPSVAHFAKGFADKLKKAV